MIIKFFVPIYYVFCYFFFILPIGDSDMNNIHTTTFCLLKKLSIPVNILKAIYDKDIMRIHELIILNLLDIFFMMRGKWFSLLNKILWHRFLVRVDRSLMLSCHQKEHDNQYPLLVD